jgi:bla regulator protein blaR1
LLFTLFWFNPFFFFYGKFIRLNHEFLADEAVLERCENRAKYQYLLLHAIGLNQTMLLTSQFNYSYTKKRFEMMNKQLNKKKAIVLQVSMLPFLMIMFLLFGKIGFAQQAKTEQKTAIHSQNDASQAIVNEYEQILKRNTTTTTRGERINQLNETDRARLEFLFLSMSKEQQNKQKYIMIPPFQPSPKISPTETEFESYKNGQIYGVWLNDKKIKNTELDKYKAADIVHVFVSKLYLNAQKTIGYKYKYQVDMMTSEHYEAYRKERLADKRYFLVSQRWMGKK